MLSFSALSTITSGKAVSIHKDRAITNLVIDSRKVAVSEEVLFFAIRGERHDGHRYLDELYAKGIRQFVVELVPSNLNDFKEANILVVENSIAALQKISSQHRQRFQIPVIGITGSNGKTIIKEWLFQLLSKSEVVVKNPGSYNSQVGVPLSVWQIQKHHTLGIFEAGISRPGEMENLQMIIRPTIGLFTNIGSAHSEGFKSLEEKIVEKLKLFEHVEWLVYCKDHKELDDVIKQHSIKSITWGTSSEADISIEKHDHVYSIQYLNNSFELSLPFEDIASVENCLHVISLMLSMGYGSDVIQRDIRTLKTIPMRLELKEGINQCYIIDDTYNNDLAGIQISLQFLFHQHQKKRKAVILSDVLESGLGGKQLSEKIAELIQQAKISHFIGVGPILCQNYQLFPSGSKFFLDTKGFLENFSSNRFENEVILIKGARVFQFEKIVSKLERKVHGTVMEIDLGALVLNLNLVKARLNKSTKVMVMVKAFAYGSGSNEIANLLQFHQVDYLGVAYPDEGVELRKNNITLPIMVMNSTAESFEQLLANQLEPEIYSFRILQSLIRFLGRRTCVIHLKVDTGMRRLGFEENDITELIKLLSQNPNIRVASIFSHLAGADDSSHDEFSNYQVQSFLRSADKLSQALGYKPLYHILNSPGILRLPQFQFDMVRLGIGLYGVNPTGMQIDFKPVATLKTLISQIKYVKAGETIGYGRRGKAEKDRRIATIAIGYADGFSRAFSRGKGKVLISGLLAPVIGNVCMDMTMVDITEISAEEGDEVIVFGRGLSIQTVAEWIDTIPYEILTNTSERVKRVFTAESL
jgi:Alr-MurF fusion protein